MAVTMTNLYVENEDFYFDGDLRLLGKTKITNGDLVVTGNLVLAIYESEEDGEEVKPTLEIINGNLSAKDLWTEDSYGICACSDDEFCEYLTVKNGDIHITDGSLDLGDCTIDEVCDIYVDTGDLTCGAILYSHSIYVNGKILSGKITTIFDLYCKDGDFHGGVTCDRDMYVENLCDLNYDLLSVRGSFECKMLSNSQFVKFGTN